MIVIVLMINTYAALKIFFFQREQLPDSAAVAEYASKPHVVVKLQSQVFSSFHLRSMIFVMILCND